MIKFLHIITYLNSMKNILIILFLIAIAHSIKFTLSIPGGDTNCFYQMLTQHQKYAIEVTPESRGYYEVNIRHQQNNEWIHSVFRSNEEHMEGVKLHKVAKHQTLYSFCIINSQANQIKLKVSFRFGLELLDLKIIPDQDDRERIERQAIWIQKQAHKIHEVVQGSAVKRRDRDQYSNLMRKKFIGYGIIGLVVLFGISVGFFYNLRKILKERKLL